MKIANYALSKQGSRYYWGAQGPTYFDCSGLVYWAHNQAGVKIGRTTAAGYAGSGKSVSYSNLQIGDVITFNYGRGVAHIGIYIGSGRMVHASGKGSETVGQDPNQCVKVMFFFITNIQSINMARGRSDISKKHTRVVLVDF